MFSFRNGGQLRFQSADRFRTRIYGKMAKCNEWEVHSFLQGDSQSNFIYRLRRFICTRRVEDFNPSDYPGAFLTLNLSLIILLIESPLLFLWDQCVKTRDDEQNIENIFAAYTIPYECEPDWILIDGMCYFVDATSKKRWQWDQARAACEDRDATLPVILYQNVSIQYSS